MGELIYMGLGFLIGVWFMWAVIMIAPLGLTNLRWTLFIWRKLNKLESLNDPSDSNFIAGHYFKVKNKSYVVVFHHSWLFEVYEGSSIEDIRHKASLGGQSNKASRLAFYEKWIGKRIESWYKRNHSQLRSCEWA